MNEELHKTKPKGIHRIKISVGKVSPFGDSATICQPTSLSQTLVEDAETGQVLFFVRGIELHHDAICGSTVHLVVDESCFELDMHIRQPAVDYALDLSAGREASLYE